MRKYISEVCYKYMDMADRDTRKAMLMMEDTDQNSVLLSLTSKLYEMIIDKTTDIDFGDIPKTKGDITMLESYEKILESISTLTEILKQFHQPTEPIDEINKAIDNIEHLKPVFKKGFQTNIEIIKTTYNTMVLSVISSLSYMISVSVYYVKSPGDTSYQITLQKSGVSRTKDTLVYESLVSFNKACNAHQIETAFNPLIKSKIRGFAGSAMGVGAIIFGISAVLMNILPILRELTYFFYVMRARFSEYLDVQADMLDMNVQLLKSNQIESIEDKKTVISRQEAIIQRFRKISEFFSANNKTKEAQADKQIKEDNKRYKLNDIVDSAPDSITDSLF